MVSVAEKASGLANEVIGKAKQGIGSAVGSDKLKEEGIAQELKGHAQKAIGDVKAVVEETVGKGVAAPDRESEVRERAYRIWQGEGFARRARTRSLVSGRKGSRRRRSRINDQDGGRPIKRRPQQRREGLDFILDNRFYQE
jgi:uncharacterized protein YjbJ (UPF0337 family)